MNNSTRYELHSFQCHSLSEAIEKIESTLGENALLMHTREIKLSIWQRMANCPALEVVGGVELHDAIEQH